MTPDAGSPDPLLPDASCMTGRDGPAWSTGRGSPPLRRARLPTAGSAAYGWDMSDGLEDVLNDLADEIGRIGPERGGDPTPCAEYDVATLRRHVLSWLPVFATALSDPQGARPRPDPEVYRAPTDPAQAAEQVRGCAADVAAALAAGVADRPVVLQGANPLPGRMVIDMLTAEVIAHGWDLARATGQSWQPPQEVCDAALRGLRGVLSPEYRGEGKSFGVEVEAAPDSTPLGRLLAFTGRTATWVPPSAG